jgi:hypothetical protein
MPLPKLTNRQIGARKAAARRVQIKRLEARLDRHVTAAENMKPGTSGRMTHLDMADITRRQLRQISH